MNFCSLKESHPILTLYRDCHIRSISCLPSPLLRRIGQPKWNLRSAQCGFVRGNESAESTDSLSRAGRQTGFLEVIIELSTCNEIFLLLDF